MSTYKYIVNPASGRRVLSDGKIGKQIIRNYLNEFQRGGSSLLRRAKATSASISRGARSAAKSTGAAAKKAKDALRVKKDKAAWAAMATRRKCELCDEVNKKDETSGKSQCDSYYETKKQQADAKAATQKAKLDTLTQQLNMHKTNAEDLKNKMQLELAQNQMLKSRLVAKEIALLTGESYVDPFGLGQHPSGSTVKSNTQAGGRKATKKQLANLAKGRAALAKKRKSNKRKSH